MSLGQCMAGGYSNPNTLNNRQVKKAFKTRVKNLIIYLTAECNNPNINNRWGKSGVKTEQF